MWQNILDILSNPWSWLVVFLWEIIRSTIVSWGREELKKLPGRVGFKAKSLMDQNIARINKAADIMETDPTLLAAFTGTIAYNNFRGYLFMGGGMLTIGMGYAALKVSWLGLVFLVPGIIMALYGMNRTALADKRVEVLEELMARRLKNRPKRTIGE